MSNILQAVKWLCDGKKVRRFGVWHEASYLFTDPDDTYFVMASWWKNLKVTDNTYCFIMDDLEAEDWEIFNG